MPIKSIHPCPNPCKHGWNQCKKYSLHWLCKCFKEYPLNTAVSPQGPTQCIWWETVKAHITGFIYNKTPQGSFNSYQIYSWILFSVKCHRNSNVTVCPPPANTDIHSNFWITNLNIYICGLFLPENTYSSQFVQPRNAVNCGIHSML